MADSNLQILHDNYRHFRNSAVALSVTIIGVSGAMLVRLEQLPIEGPSVLIKAPFQITFVVCIISSLFLQYKHYLGYKDLTHHGFDELFGSEDEEETKKLKKTSDEHFTEVEKFAKWSFNLCVCGVAAFFIFNAGLEIGQWFSS